MTICIGDEISFGYATIGNGYFGHDIQPSVTITLASILWCNDYFSDDTLGNEYFGVNTLGNNYFGDDTLVTVTSSLYSTNFVVFYLTSLSISDLSHCVLSDVIFSIRPI